MFLLYIFVINDYIVRSVSVKCQTCLSSMFNNTRVKYNIK